MEENGNNKERVNIEEEDKKNKKKGVKNKKDKKGDKGSENKDQADVNLHFKYLCFFYILSLKT